jgi:hypothetical protein
VTELTTSPGFCLPRVLSRGIVISLCVVVLIVGFLTQSSLGLYGADFRGQYLVGARSVVAGQPLYMSPEQFHLVPRGVQPYVYPPLTAVALVPLTTLSDEAAVVVGLLACVAAVIGALALVGLRDVRCYAAIFASAPMWSILETANLTAFLTLGLALAWRFRTRVWRLAAVLGLAVAAKLLLWPLLVWVAVTNRQGAFVRVIATAIGTTLVAWAVIGFQGLTAYPALLQSLTDEWADYSYSLIGISDALGLGAEAGRVPMVLAGGALLAATVSFGRRGYDLRAFTCAITAALALTPIAWIQYIWFLLVPLAIARPRFSGIWLIPLVTWLIPRSGNGTGMETFVPALVVVVLFVVILARSREGGAVAEPT